MKIRPSDMNNTAILRLKKNDDIYRHLEGNNYKNLRTGVTWEIPEDKSPDLFVIDYNSTMMFNKYPLLEELVFKLKLKLDK